jgi:hypothetical protein
MRFGRVKPPIQKSPEQPCFTRKWFNPSLVQE